MGSIYISKVIAKAKEWVGYHEDPDAPNWVIFTKILDECGYYAPQEKQGTPWCGHFCNAILLMSAEPSDRDDEAKKYDAQNYQYQPSYNNLSSSCRYYADYFREAGEFYEDGPEVGDIIFFGPRGAETHQGIVIDTEDYITTIEGNAGDAVQKKWYSYDEIGKNISGFGRPSYDGYAPEKEPAASDKENNKPTPAEPSDETPEPKNELYRVNVNYNFTETAPDEVFAALRLRTHPQESAAVLALIPDGDIVKVEQTAAGWAKITYGPCVGWACLDYLVEL